MERIIIQIKAIEGVTEMQKATDPLGWTRIMNNIRNRAEEILLKELIYMEDAV